MVANQQKTFNNTIKRSYIKNVDYTLEKIKSIEDDSHNFEIITLTIEASKKYVYQQTQKLANGYDNIF